jgi:hypothetical protein
MVMIIDITKRVGFPLRHKEKQSIKSQMISWFEQNVGLVVNCDLDNSIYTGDGWKWFKHVTYDTGSQGQQVTYTSYFVEIADEAAATMFRLKFL